MTMYRANAISELRKNLSAKGLQAIIIPTNDPHFGEYTQDYYKVRAWLSGFTGSAGTLVVTMESAALWTDSRYFVQAEKELAGTDIELMKMKMPGTPSVEEWLRGKLSGVKGAVAIDQAIFSYSEYMGLKSSLAPECSVVPVEDFFSGIWSDRPELVFNTITHLPVGFSGEDTSSKYAGIVEKLAPCVGKNGVVSDSGDETPFAYVVTACDEVAWLCNMRGSDIEYNPVAQAYAVVTNECIHLFAAVDKMERDLKEYLAEQDVVLHQYGDFAPFLQSLGSDVLRICSKSKLSVRDYNALECGADVRFVDDPVTGGALNRLKAVKNEVELEGFRVAYLYDGVAWCKLLKFIDDSLSSGKILTEYEIGEKLIEFRSQRIEYRGESFEPIVAYGPNGALPHYSATADCCSTIPVPSSADSEGSGNFLLMDTGGQYLFGTTDTTRTIPVGKLDDDKKRFYTLVLKGMIDLSLAKFPAGTRGAQLDILARGPLFSEGAMYFHGTGHGTGHNLCVHEGPQSIRMEENPVTLDEGMVMSNEPAIYFNGRYGIRTENVIGVKFWKETEFNKFYEFETFTMVPIATSCILPGILTKVEIEWLNGFNAKVYSAIAPLLDSDQERAWLAEATKPVEFC